jgi:hypothetical protein
VVQVVAAAWEIPGIVVATWTWEVAAYRVAVVPSGRDDSGHIANRNWPVGLVAPAVAEVVAVLRFPLSRSIH